MAGLGELVTQGHDRVLDRLAGLPGIGMRAAGPGLERGLALSTIASNQRLDSAAGHAVWLGRPATSYQVPVPGRHSSSGSSQVCFGRRTDRDGLARVAVQRRSGVKRAVRPVLIAVDFAIAHDPP
jgi:hypothetical protein